MRGYFTSAASFQPSQAQAMTTRSPMRRLMVQENHEVGEYGLLNKAVNRQMKRKKKKKAVVSDCLSHCQSLDHLQRLNAEKNDEIRRHIYEKAEFQAHNEELKQMISNPTMREHQLHLKIAQLEEENKALKQRLERQQNSHRQELESIRYGHKAQLESLHQSHMSTIQQHRGYSLEPRRDVHRIETVPKVEITANRPSNYEVRQYQPPSQSTQNITSKQEVSPRVQVISSPSSSMQQQQQRTYVPGAPVYISASRPEESKPITRTISPDTSKNTTSQTRVYRGDSPQIIASTLKPAHEANQMQATRVISNTKQEKMEPRFETIKTDMSSYNNVENRSSWKGTVGISSGAFGQNDLQEIYRKYCIE